MRLTIDKTDVDRSLVTYNDGLNYGRFDFPGLEIHNYAVFFPQADFIRLVSTDYLRCMDELNDEDEFAGEVCPLAAAGFPPLDTLLTNFALAADTIKTFLDRDTFAAFGMLNSTADLVINSTDSVYVDSEYVVINGRCFRRTDA